MPSSQEVAPQQSGPLNRASSTEQTTHADAGAPESAWGRIKRHKVVEWTLAYVAFGYALLHGVEMVREAFAWPEAVPRLTIFALLLGTPVAATLAYYHGQRAQHRVTRMEISILAVMLVVAGSVLWFVSRSLHGGRAASVALLAGTPSRDARLAFSPPARSVAVLPFANLSGDPTQDYFSDGMTEELINDLTHIDALEVTARTSSFAFKGKNVDIGAIARKLNVGAILEGSIRRSGRTVRITAELVNAVSGFDLWSQTYDRDTKDVLQVQSDVATAVVRQLRVKLTGEIRSRIELGGTNNPAAYDEYLRGQQLRIRAGSSLDEAGYRAALAQFDKAIALDPNYALAYVAKAKTLDTIAVFFSPAGQLEVGSEARTAAERAVSLAPELGEAHEALAGTLAYSFLNFSAALPEFNRALALAPGSSAVQSAYGSFAAQLGHVDAAIEASTTAVRLDPENLDALTDLGQTLTWVRHYGEALTALQHALVLDPQSEFIKANIAYALLALGQTDRARLLCESLSTPKGLEARHWCLALAYHALNRQADAERELGKLRAIDGDGAPEEYAAIYAQFGQKDEALKWLTIAVDRRDAALQGLRANWDLDPIRGDPRFKALERRLNFPP
jgi:TolB-like protein/tetratricopeptide (TPR) repeat protein